MEKFQLVVTAKHEFEYRNLSGLIELFGIRTINIPVQGSLRNDFSIESSFTNVEASTEIFMDQIKPLITEKHEFEERHLSSLLILLDYQVSDARNRVNISSREWFGPSRNISTDNLIERIEQVFNKK